MEPMSDIGTGIGMDGISFFDYIRDYYSTGIKGVVDQDENDTDETKEKEEKELFKMLKDYLVKYVEQIFEDPDQIVDRVLKNRDEEIKKLEEKIQEQEKEINSLRNELNALIPSIDPLTNNPTPWKTLSPPWLTTSGNPLLDLNGGITYTATSDPND